MSGVKLTRREELEFVAGNLRKWVHQRFGVWITWKSAIAAAEAITPSGLQALGGSNATSE